MKCYRLKYRLTMSHSATNRRENEHNHVLEIEIFAYPQMNRFVEFGEMEEIVSQCLDGYQNRYLNDMEEFCGDTSLENKGEILYLKLEKAFLVQGWTVERFEISETPLRVYVITKNTYQRGCSR